MTTGEKIRRLRQEKGLTMEELGNMVGVKKAAIHKYETGLVVNIKRSTLTRLAQALEVNPEYLLDFDQSANTSPGPSMPSEETLIPYPVIGNIAAGYDSPAIEEATGYMEHIPWHMLRGHNPEDFFVLRVSGDSMYPQFLDGDRVLVRRCDSVDKGNIAVVMYNAEDATLKKVNYNQGEPWLELIPCNPEYKTKRLEGSELEHCRILGKVVKLIRDID